MGRTDWRADSGGIVAGWLLKIALVFAVVGVVLYDTVAISYGRVAAEDDARTVATAASDAMIVKNVSADKALKIAIDRADSRGITLDPDAVTIDKKGVVTVTVHREVDTLIAGRIGPLQDLTDITETYTTTPLKS